MDDYVLTLYDENGAPVPIPAIQGIGIKNIRFKEARESEDTYEIVLDDETMYTFTVKHGISPHIGENGNWWIGTTDTGVPSTMTSEGSGLPEYTEADEGKFLRIVGGSPTWQAVVNGEEVKF